MIQSSVISKHEVRIRMVAAVASLVVGIFVLTLKFWAYNKTGSHAIYSDALESIVNVVTALLGLIVVYYASLPVDDDHPYGHGKVEYFSAAFEGGLVTFAGILVIIEAVKAVYSKDPLHNLDFGAWVIFGASLINLALGIGLKWAGKKYASPALVASGVHVTTDFITSAGAIVGILFVMWLELTWIDTAVAVLLGMHMTASGVSLVMKSTAGLLDAEDIQLLEELAKVFEQHTGDGIIQIHHTRIIRAGWFHHIDAHVVVPEFWDVQKAHERLDRFEHGVIHSYRFGGEANFHLDPCQRNYCRVCDYKDCPIRKEAFVQKMPVVLEHLRSKNEPVEFRK